MGPEPIQNELPGIAFCDEVTVRGKGHVPRHVERNALVLDRRPARSGKAVLGRMDGVSGALAAEVGDKEIDVIGCLRILIDAQKKVAGAEDVEDFLVDGNVSAGPSAELCGKLFQSETVGEDFAAGARLQEDGCDGDEYGCEDEARRRSSSSQRNLALTRWLW